MNRMGMSGLHLTTDLYRYSFNGALLAKLAF
jgi:hypothetical protein